MMDMISVGWASVSDPLVALSRRNWQSKGGEGASENAGKSRLSGTCCISGGRRYF